MGTGPAGVGHPDPALLAPAHHAVARRQAERRPARQDDGVDPGDGALGGQQVPFPGARGSRPGPRRRPRSRPGTAPPCTRSGPPGRSSAPPGPPGDVGDHRRSATLLGPDARGRLRSDGGSVPVRRSQVEQPGQLGPALEHHHVPAAGEHDAARPPGCGWPGSGLCQTGVSRSRLPTTTRVGAGSGQHRADVEVEQRVKQLGHDGRRARPRSWPAASSTWVGDGWAPKASRQ